MLIFPKYRSRRFKINITNILTEFRKFNCLNIHGTEMKYLISNLLLFVSDLNSISLYMLIIYYENFIVSICGKWEKYCWRQESKFILRYTTTKAHRTLKIIWATKHKVPIDNGALWDVNYKLIALKLSTCWDVLQW